MTGDNCCVAMVLISIQDNMTAICYMKRFVDLRLIYAI